MCSYRNVWKLVQVYYLQLTQTPNHCITIEAGAGVGLGVGVGLGLGVGVGLGLGLGVGVDAKQVVQLLYIATGLLEFIVPTLPPYR